MKLFGRVVPRDVGTVDELLAKLGWLPDLGCEVVAYRDRDDRHALMSVHATSTGAALLLPDEQLLSFTRLQAGHLRGAVQRAVFAGDRVPGIDLDRGGARHQAGPPPRPTRITEPQEK